MELKVETSKVNFMLNPDWIIQPPIDFEHKKYVLLSYLKKCEEKFSLGEIYPYFIELSLHFANARVLEKENKILYTDKIFRSPDDELLVQELKSLIIPNFTPEENLELLKINKYFGLRIYEFFSVAKSIWSLAFESTDINLKKNRKNLTLNKGYVYYRNTFNNHTYVWEYTIEDEISGIDNKCIFNLIEDTESSIKRMGATLRKKTSFIEDNISELPVFEVMCSQNFPIPSTLGPIFKRKLMNFIYQKMKRNRLIEESKEV